MLQPGPERAPGLEPVPERARRLEQVRVPVPELGLGEKACADGDRRREKELGSIASGDVDNRRREHAAPCCRRVLVDAVK